MIAFSVWFVMTEIILFMVKMKIVKIHTRDKKIQNWIIKKRLYGSCYHFECLN